ncbi:MAG: TPM domain-containing protein [Clostridia bacterium]|nr:TPM domain-containing protein [Clostridia bacterium]
MRINRRFIPTLLLALLIASVFLPCFAVSAQADSEPSFGSMPSRYNSETGYSAVIADEADLLTADEETRLLDKMYPLTEYANIAVYTVDTPTKLQDYERAREKRAELFGADADAAVFMVDMYLRRIIIQRRGNMETYFNNSRANNITNNVASIAKKGDYYKTCATAMDQMLSVVRDRNNAQTDDVPKTVVPRPMMYLSNGVIALMFGAMISYFIAVKTSTTVRKSVLKKVSSSETISMNEEPLQVTILSSVKVGERSVARSTGSGGGSSCSSSSCGSSCGGGSSCGSSCGGSSF